MQDSSLVLLALRGVEPASAVRGLLSVEQCDEVQHKLEELQAEVARRRVALAVRMEDLLVPSPPLDHGWLSGAPGGANAYESSHTDTATFVLGPNQAEVQLSLHAASNDDGHTSFELNLTHDYETLCFVSTDKDEDEDCCGVNAVRQLIECAGIRAWTSPRNPPLFSRPGDRDFAPAAAAAAALGEPPTEPHVWPPPKSTSSGAGGREDSGAVAEPAPEAPELRFLADLVNVALCRIAEVQNEGKESWKMDPLNVGDTSIARLMAWTLSGGKLPALGAAAVRSARRGWQLGDDLGWVREHEPWRL